MFERKAGEQHAVAERLTVDAAAAAANWAAATGPLKRDDAAFASQPNSVASLHLVASICHSSIATVVAVAMLIAAAAD